MWSERVGTNIFPRGLTIVVGVEGDHDNEDIEWMLDQVMSWMMTHPGMPLLPKSITGDCMVGPPERGSRHFEVRWIVV
jgi:hypothetical protein